MSGLKQAWTFHITGPAAAGVAATGALAANPIVMNGVVYIQDLDANVYALALATGKLKWEYQLNTPMKSGPGPDGVAVAGGTVYGISPTTVFALNARTGKKIWVDSHLLGKGQGTFEIQPQVADGRVYLASAYGSGPGGGCFSRSARQAANCCGDSTPFLALTLVLRLLASARAAPGRRRWSAATDR
ncbi:MAG TPA: PQQ-binding-like beta-propeller repeat protein [Streptosporangiaceae bacterium]